MCRIITFFDASRDGTFHFGCSQAPNSKDVQSIDSEEGEKIISRPRCAALNQTRSSNGTGILTYFISYRSGAIASPCTETPPATAAPTPVHM